MIYPLIEQILGVEFLNIESLIFTVGSIIAMIIASYVAPKYGLHEMRAIPQVDAIPEAIGVCAEKGLPLVHTIGQQRPDNTGIGRDVPATQEVVKLISQQCAELNVRHFHTMSDPTIQLMTIDYGRQGALLAGHPERFNPDDVVPLQGGYSVILGTIGIQERYNCQALIIWGNFSFATQMPIMEMASRRGNFIISGNSWTTEGIMGAFFTDLVAIMEEMTATGAYLSKDVKQGANQFGEDLCKLAYIAYILFVMVATYAGVTF
jgi:hypothetical protein